MISPILEIYSVPMAVVVYAGDRLDVGDHVFRVTRRDGRIDGIPFLMIRGFTWRNVMRDFDRETHDKLYALLGNT